MAAGKRAIIACNGNIETGLIEKTRRKNDFFICADGGANHFLKTKIVPNIIVGDMDSITENAKRIFSGVEKLAYPKNMNFTDSELALRLALEHGFNEIVFLGATGSRTDHLLSNVMLLSQVPEGIDARIAGEKSELFLVRKSRTVKGKKGDRVSLIPVENVSGLSLSGFKFNARNISLKVGEGRGMSNELTGRKALISLKKGRLIAVRMF